MKPNKLLDFEAEYHKVKKNNRNLAKALAEQQQISKKYLDEINLLHKKVYVASNLNMQYEKALNELLKSLKQSITSCVTLTNNLSETVILCNESTNLQKTFVYDNDINASNKVTLRSSSPAGPHKTHAVKPMVSGHVIHHPIINLSRLIETRVTDQQSADSIVQNDNSVENDQETININEIVINNNDSRSLIRNHLPVRRFTPNILDESDENFSENLVLSEEENNDSSQEDINHVVSNLYSLAEVNEEETNNSINNSITKELRILIEPLHLESINSYMKEKCNSITQPDKFRAKRNQADPLEGTSSMLDNTGNPISCNNYNSKPRLASKRICTQYESDSEESTITSEQKEKRWVTKRKAATEKKDITGQKYKVKRNKGSSESNISINNSLERSHEENTRISFVEDLSGRRSQRSSASKCLAEPSLKRKLRR